MPFAAAGVGRDFSADRVNYIFAGGVRSLATFDWRSVDLYLGNRLFYAGYTTSDFEFGDDFGALESGLDVRHSLGFSLGDHQVDGGLFVMNYLYFVSPELIRFYGKRLSVDVQGEVRRHVGDDDSLEGPRAHDTQDRHELSRRKRRFDLPTRSGWTLSLKVLRSCPRQLRCAVQKCAGRFRGSPVRAERHRALEDPYVLSKTSEGRRRRRQLSRGARYVFRDTG